MESKCDARAFRAASSGSGAIAAIAYIFALYLDEFVSLPHFSPALEKWPLVIPFLGTLFPLEHIGTKAAGGILIGGLTYLNIRGVKLGALVQSVSTSAKVLAISAASPQARRQTWRCHSPLN